MGKEKLYYSMEDAVNKISEKFNLGLKVLHYEFLVPECSQSLLSPE